MWDVIPFSGFRPTFLQGRSPKKVGHPGSKRNRNAVTPCASDVVGSITPGLQDVRVLLSLRDLEPQ